MLKIFQLRIQWRRRTQQTLFFHNDNHLQTDLIRPLDIGIICITYKPVVLKVFLRTIEIADWESVGKTKLQFSSYRIDFINDKFHVLKGDVFTYDNHAEKVWFVVNWLVTTHHRPSISQFPFDHWWNSIDFLAKFFVGKIKLAVTQPLRQVEKADICACRLKRKKQILLVSRSLCVEW